MNATVRCTCGKTLEVTDDLRGKQARCPSCSKVIDIPDSLDEIPALKEAQAQQTPVDGDVLYEQVVDSVVGIAREGGYGSGVFINHSGLIATTKHIVGTDDKTNVRLADSSEKQGEVVGSFADHDLAFIKVGLSGSKYARLQEHPSLKVGQKVFASGRSRASIRRSWREPSVTCPWRPTIWTTGSPKSSARRCAGRIQGRSDFQA